jgi:hypothetical protein
MRQPGLAGLEGGAAILARLPGLTTELAGPAPALAQSSSVTRKAFGRAAVFWRTLLSSSQFRAPTMATITDRKPAKATELRPGKCLSKLHDFYTERTFSVPGMQEHVPPLISARCLVRSRKAGIRPNFDGGDLTR